MASLALLLTAIKGLCLNTSVVYNASIMANEKQPAETPEPPADQPKPELTEDEQMAAYEEDLKSSDWGHQPC